MEASICQLIDNVGILGQTNRKLTKLLPSSLTTIPKGFPETLLSVNDELRVFLTYNHPPNVSNNTVS